MTENEQQSEFRQWEGAMLRWILGLLSVAIVGGIGWMWSIDRNVQTLNEQTKSGVTSIERVENENRTQDRELAVLAARVRVVEDMVARQDERWRQVGAAIDRMSGRLNQVIELVQERNSRQ